MEATAISTQNKKGFTYQLTSFGKAFVNAASKATKPVMDIGAAYGVATMPALESGATVIAVDISEDHLLKISKTVDPLYHNRLITLRDKFPEFDMPSGSLSAVYMSQVLPFLKGEEIELAARKIFDWLIPGGEVFVVSFTPYISHVASFIPMYEKLKKDGARWAGYINNVSTYSNDPNIYLQLPEQIHHIDGDDLKWAFHEAGFVVEEARYFGEEEGPLPTGIRLDGRERIGMIAHKPAAVSDSEAKTVWQRVSAIDLDVVPAAVRDWLYKPQILTSALRRVCDDFNIHVSTQGINVLYSDEISAMKAFDSPYGFVREAFLGGESGPLVYARVSMPLTTYYANRNALDSLGNRPIGETLLYNRASISRSELEVKKLSQNDELLFNGTVHDNYFKAEIQKVAKLGELWARRSVFMLEGNPMLITEVFLINIPQYRD